MTDVNVLCSIGMRTVLAELAPAFERANNHRIAAVYDSSNALAARIARGESGDIALFTAPALDALIAQGKVAQRIDLCRSLVGIAVAKGAAKPDIGSADALKRALLAARAVAHSKSGASGLYFLELVERLGIAAAVKAKAKVQDGVVAEVVARGEADIAVQQISELMQSAGVDVVGPLPDSLQSITIFSAGVFTDALAPQAAEALAAYLGSGSVAPVYRAKGLEPV